MDILESLNAAQRDAVTCADPVLQVLAPPGSGKTKTLTTRVAHLISRRQLKPWNIIVCTFTKKAASEMKERIKGFVGAEMARQLKLGTFHGVALNYLRQYGQHIGLPKDFGVADTGDSKAILKRIIKQNGFAPIIDSQALSRISGHKAKGRTCEEFFKDAKNVDQREFAQIWQGYQAGLEASNLLDYDDILLRCCFLLRTHPHCVSNVEAVLIDEFQDTNSIQYDLMGLFAQKRNTVTIVGDPDQSIYGWRSAEIGNLRIMKEKWPETMTINLEMNYRSSGAILHAAQQVIEQDESRPPKRLQATHSLGLRPVLRKLPSAASEADWLVSEIKRVQALTGNLLQASDFAVLLRTASISRVIEAAMARAGVPYCMVGGTRFYDRLEVKLILDYLRVINQTANSEAVERTLNVPSRSVGDATIKALREEAAAKGVTLWTFVLDIVRGRSKSKIKINTPGMKGLGQYVDIILSGRKKISHSDAGDASVVDLMRLVAKKLNLQKYLKEKFGEEEEARWANIEELMAQAADASDPERLRMTAEENSLPAIEGLEQRSTSDVEDTLSLFLANIALTTTSAEKAEKDGEMVQQITISTIHSAKGLEWPVVFIPACYEGSIPHSRAEDNDEERRLLYVGMTRGQAMLYLSSPCKNTTHEETTLSSFLTQPGVSRFFEEHGPSLANVHVAGLATTLRRQLPEPATIAETCATLERDEDNYWPLNGEMPHRELAKWDLGRAESTLPVYGITARPAAIFTSATVTMQQQQGFTTASTTMKSGFVSAADRFEELMEESRLKNVDKRAEQAAKDKEGQDKPKGRKRQIEGQSTLSSFFGKRPKPADEDVGTLPTQLPGARATRDMPLKEIRNFQPASTVHNPAVAEKPAILSQHRVRNAPMLNKPAPTSSFDGAQSYVFLSSSPPKPDDPEDSRNSNTVAASDEVQESATDQAVQTWPASTLHMTSSMQQRRPQQRKTLGMRRSLHGWNTRGGKG